MKNFQDHNRKKNIKTYNFIKIVDIFSISCGRFCSLLRLQLSRATVVSYEFVYRGRLSFSVEYTFKFEST